MFELQGEVVSGVCFFCVCVCVCVCVGVCYCILYTAFMELDYNW